MDGMMVRDDARLAADLAEMIFEAGLIRRRVESANWHSATDGAIAALKRGDRASAKAWLDSAYRQARERGGE